MNNLTIGEFTFLQSLMQETQKEDECIVGEIDKTKLEKDGFIKITGANMFVLREKGREMFVDKRNNFYRFVNTFPIKTPSGRYLSPRSLEGIAINKLKDKWKKLFKENVFKEDMVIRVLEAEIAWRKKTNQLEFMNACDGWLNMANYEKFEYLLDDEQTDKAKDDYYSM